MAQKILFQTALTDLEGTDVEGIGVLRKDEYGRVYRWVKNKSSTALVKAGPCLVPITGIAHVALASVKKVYTIDVGSEVTASVKRPAGVAMTAIQASGAVYTGDHGWIQVKGVGKCNFYSSDTAVTVGQLAIATSGIPSTCVFGPAFTEVANSATSAYAYGKFVQLIEVPATVGAATAMSAAVDIHCL